MNRFYKAFHWLYYKIISTGNFNIPIVKYLFKPSNNSHIETSNVNVMADDETHKHKPKIHPVVEKQTLIKEKRK